MLLPRTLADLRDAWCAEHGIDPHTPSPEEEAEIARAEMIRRGLIKPAATAEPADA